MQHVESKPHTKAHIDWTYFESSALYDWNGYTKLVGELTDGTTTEADDAEYWAVYCHQNDDSIELLARFNTKDAATDFQHMLQTILTLDLPRPW